MTLATIAARAWEITEEKNAPDAAVKSDGSRRGKQDSWTGRLVRRSEAAAAPANHCLDCDAEIDKHVTRCRDCYLVIMRRKKAG